MGWKSAALDVARRSGALAVFGAAALRGRIAVLAYHRIADAGARGLEGFRGNVSATPDDFAAQLDWIGRRCEVISLDDLLAWMDGGARLPTCAAMITFDDGYRDNLEAAAPILAERGMPATLFLTTGPTDGGPALFWDRVAAAFALTSAGAAVLPGVGERAWETAAERDRVAHEVVYATKRLPLEERARVLDDLGAALGVEVPERLPGLYLDWDGVRDLGWAVGAHTVRHPVLTAVGHERAVEEIALSRNRIEQELGRRVRAFAYPNGLVGDIDERAAAEAGIDLAFTLRQAPARRREVRAHPLAVRRSCVYHNDSVATFAAKASGIARLVGAGP
ncbi:MAG: polysaccharide deacetylase family protein [Actinobacteria bacterium]|nr:polysaccharide deacetylase family protein [Actinomycetota bacterium]